MGAGQAVVSLQVEAGHLDGGPAESGGQPGRISVKQSENRLEGVAPLIADPSQWNLNIKGEQGSKSKLGPCVNWENTSHFYKIRFVP